MGTSRLIAAFAGLLALGLLAADASAMYHPTLGRFVQRDPLGTPLESPMRRNVSSPQFTQRDPIVQYHDGMNLYQYARSSPVLYGDPSGLVPEIPVDPKAPCGTFQFRRTSVRDVTRPGLSPGYNVDFDPTARAWGTTTGTPCTACKCDGTPPLYKDSLRLVQAAKATGATYGHDPHMDYSSASTAWARNKRTRGGIDPPGQRFEAPPYGDFGFEDAPAAVSPNEFEICAICKKGDKDVIVGCVTFSYDSNDAKAPLKIPGATLNTKPGINWTIDSAQPGPLWNGAMKAWSKEGGSEAPK